MATAVILQSLLLPVHALLAWLYLALRGSIPRAPWRRYDAGTIVLAVCAWVAAAVWGYGADVQGYSAIWPVVYATAAGYTAFNAVLWPAFLYRRWAAAQAR